MKIDPEALRTERLVAELTQEELADWSGVSRSTVQDAERAEPRHPKDLDTVRALAAALGCSLDRFAAPENDVERRILEREAANV